MNRRGFTLIETMIATVIMAGALIVIGSAWSGNHMRIEKARVNANMAALLERKMTELELEYRGKPIADIKDEDAGTFSDEYKEFRWEMKAKEFEVPDLSSLLGGGSKDSGNSANKEIIALIVKTVSDYVKTAVKEVTVSVYYKSPRVKTKELKQSIATYFVDYTKPVSISGLPAGATGADGGAGTGASGGSGTGAK
jgi:general secretion pathway protein I